MRKYPNAPWKEDKIKCVVLMKDKYDKNNKLIPQGLLKVFVTKDTSKKMKSEEIKEKLPTTERFKYNLCPDIKMSIPRRVFEQFLNNPDIDNYFTTPLDMGKGNLIGHDIITKIKKELWYDSAGAACALYFKGGQLLHYEKGK